MPAVNVLIYTAPGGPVCHAEVEFLFQNNVSSGERTGHSTGKRTSPAGAPSAPTHRQLSRLGVVAYCLYSRTAEKGCSPQPDLPYTRRLFGHC